MTPLSVKQQEWQLPPLPDEVQLHDFDYLDLSATVAAQRVSRHWHELANDPRYSPDPSRTGAGRWRGRRGWY